MYHPIPCSSTHCTLPVLIIYFCKLFENNANIVIYAANVMCRLICTMSSSQTQSSHAISCVSFLQKMEVDDAPPANHEGIKQYYSSKIEGLQVCTLFYSTLMIVSFWTDGSRQSVETQVSLLFLIRVCILFGIISRVDYS